MHLFHLQSIQAMQPDNYELCTAFAQWNLRKCATFPLFPIEMLFSNGAFFTREGSFNTYNEIIWIEKNLHAIRCSASQSRISFNVLVDIITDHLIGPYLLPFRLTGRNCLLMLRKFKEVLTQLLGDEQISSSTQ